MKQKWCMVLALVCLLLTACKTEEQEAYQFQTQKPKELVAEFQVEEFGVMRFRLFPEQAKKAVENFVSLCKEGYYDNTIFHKVIQDFMIQGGDKTDTGEESSFSSVFEDEIAEELHPYRGALCMANQGEDTNGSQFFIVQTPSSFFENLEKLLAFKGMGLQEYLTLAYDINLTAGVLQQYQKYGGAPWLEGHHTIFGQLIEGEEVLDEIAKISVQEDKRPYKEVRIQSVRVQEIERTKADEK